MAAKNTKTTKITNFLRNFEESKLLENADFLYNCADSYCWVGKLTVDSEKLQKLIARLCRKHIFEN